MVVLTKVDGGRVEAENGRSRRPRSTASTSIRCGQTGRTFCASSPLRPGATSNSTAWPSVSVLKPSPWMFETCTKTSSPRSREMNPKPLSPLKNFTVPCTNTSLLHDEPPSWRLRRLSLRLRRPGPASAGDAAAASPPRTLVSAIPHAFARSSRAPFSDTRRSGGEEGEASHGDRCKNGNGGLRRTTCEHELEERDGVAQPALQRPEGAVPPPDHEGCALDEERDDGETEQSVSTPDERTRPDVAETHELNQGDQRVTEAEACGGTAEHLMLPWWRHTMDARTTETAPTSRRSGTRRRGDARVVRGRRNRSWRSAPGVEVGVHGRSVGDGVGLSRRRTPRSSAVRWNDAGRAPLRRAGRGAGQPAAWS